MEHYSLLHKAKDFWTKKQKIHCHLRRSCTLTSQTSIVRIPSNFSVKANTMEISHRKYVFFSEQNPTLSLHWPDFWWQCVSSFFSIPLTVIDIILHIIEEFEKLPWFPNHHHENEPSSCECNNAKIQSVYSWKLFAINCDWNYAIDEHRKAQNIPRIEWIIYSIRWIWNDTQMQEIFSNFTKIHSNTNWPPSQKSRAYIHVRFYWIIEKKAEMCLWFWETIVICETHATKNSMCKQSMTYSRNKRRNEIRTWKQSSRIESTSNNSLSKCSFRLLISKIPSKSLMQTHCNSVEKDPKKIKCAACVRVHSSCFVFRIYHFVDLVIDKSINWIKNQNKTKTSKPLSIHEYLNSCLRTQIWNRI